MTIAENIAYAKPGAPLADVRGAARLANAEGFILQMDGGCDAETRLGPAGRSGARPAPPAPPPLTPPSPPPPHRYDARPGEKGVRISGGQKQRVAIARAVLKDPKLLLLDEATSALDSGNEAVVQAALDNLMQGKTTVVIAHRLSTVVRATQIIVLDKGVAVERGTHQQLCAKPDSKYAYFMRHQLVGEDKK